MLLCIKFWKCECVNEFTLFDSAIHISSDRFNIFSFLSLLSFILPFHIRLEKKLLFFQIANYCSFRKVDDFQNFRTCDLPVSRSPIFEKNFEALDKVSKLKQSHEGRNFFLTFFCNFKKVFL